MPPITAGHIEQSPFFAQRSFQEVRFGPRLLGGDGLTPKVVGNAMEKIFEPVAAVGHQSGSVAAVLRGKFGHGSSLERSVRARCITAARVASSKLAMNSARRARQSWLLRWSDNTTPPTGRVSGSLTSNG